MHDAEVSDALVAEFAAMSRFIDWIVANKADVLRQNVMRDATRAVGIAHRRVRAAHVAVRENGEGARIEMWASCEALIALIQGLIGR